jgi:serine/threonine protein kinase
MATIDPTIPPRSRAATSPVLNSSRSPTFAIQFSPDEDPIPRVRAAASALFSLGPNCRVFRASLAYIMRHIRSVFNAMQSISQRQLTPLELQAIQRFCAMLAQFKEILPSIDSDHWLDTAINSPSTHMHKFFGGIRETLRDICKQLSLDADRVIEFDAAQDNVNRAADLKHLRQALKDAREEAISRPNPVDFQQQIEGRLASISEKLGDEGSGETRNVAGAGAEGAGDLKDRMEKELAVFQSINIPFDDLKVEGSLGVGGFGTVSRAIRVSTGEILAVKEVRSDNLTLSAWASLYSELATMANLHHRYVLELVGAHVKEPYRIITRFCGGKSLFDRLHKPGETQLSPQQLTIIAYQIALGMEYLHEMRVVHRDLKTMNILLDDCDNAQIADFGLAGSIKDDQELAGGVGTPHYTAPEVLERKRYGKKVDVYSFGIMLWEMATGKIPYANKTHLEIIDLAVTKNWRLPFTAEVNDPLKKLITACWSRTPDERPDFREIVAFFRAGGILRNGCTVTRDQLDPPVPCPPLDLKYLSDTLKNPSSSQYTHIVDFLIGHIDEKVRISLRRERVLDVLSPSSSNLVSALVLASDILEPSGFVPFLETKGGKIIESLLASGSSESVIAIARFCLKVPPTAQPVILAFLPAIIRWIDDKAAGPFIVRLLGTLPVEQVAHYTDSILRFFKGEGLDTLSQESEVAAIGKLLPLIVESLSPADLLRFVSILERGFDVPLSLIDLLIERTSGNALSRLAFALVRSSPRTDISAPLSDILAKCNQSDLAELANQMVVFEIIATLFEQRRMVDTALLLLFYLASVPFVPVAIASHPVLPALLQLEGHQAQRLQILTGLVTSEEFCEKTTVIEGIQKLLISSISVEHLSDYCLMLMGALSSHPRGCLLIQETGMLSLFSHLFLSSNVGDTNTAYTIIRNAARGQAEIPQISLIVSCLMQELLYAGGTKAELLITLRELAINLPDTINEHDLQNSVLPLISTRKETREAATSITHALNLLASCDMSKLRGFFEKLLQKVFDVLNTGGLLYPQLIAAAAKLIALMPGFFTMNTFLQETDFVGFLSHVQEEIGDDFPDVKVVLNDSITTLSGGGEVPSLLLA